MPARTVFLADTTSATRSKTTDAVFTASSRPTAPPSHKSNAAIIAPAVILSMFALGVVVFFLVRRRRRQHYSQVNTDRSLHQPQPPGSEANPLLAAPIAWPQNGGVVEGGQHRRGLSGDGATLVQSPRSRALEPSDSDSYTSSPRRVRNIGSPSHPNRAIPPTRTPDGDAVSTPISTFSESSASTRVEQEVNGEARANARWTLPPIPLTEPLTEDMLRTNSASRNPFARPSRSRSRGNSLRPRTILLSAPMAPLIENKVANHDSKRSPQPSPGPAQGNTDRWSSAADPGGSHPRVENNNPYSQTSPTATSSGFGFGFGLLTSAFRKSLSVSSIASDTTNLHHAYPTHTNLHSANNTRATLQQFPSADSLGAASGTGSNSSGDGTYYSAVSMSEFGASRGHWIGSGSRSSTRRNMESTPGALTPRSRTPSNRNSVTTYPSISSLPSLPAFSMRSSAATAVPPLPNMLSTAARPRASSEGQFATGPSDTPVPFTSPPPPPDSSLPSVPPPTRQGSASDPNVKAHLRPPAARRVVPGLTRAGPSTHGVIDVVEGS